MFARTGLLEMDEAPLEVECWRMGPWTGRGADVSAVLDLMIHDLDLMHRLVPGARCRSRCVCGAPNAAATPMKSPPPSASRTARWPACTPAASPTSAGAACARLCRWHRRDRFHHARNPQHHAPPAGRDQLRRSAVGIGCLLRALRCAAKPDLRAPGRSPPRARNRAPDRAGVRVPRPQPDHRKDRAPRPEHLFTLRLEGGPRQMLPLNFDPPSRGG